ncbi:superoxide dismutase [Cu-Zn]-like [Limulus polyphemus]|uniref:Superoxide dismutase [Cu-Zn] n=1 Tax=Limulus polyphemus TaxID=6850 RepID=A0ABM1RWY0_LIMPO|nr:superoxide dismutase [Cu-Zn]-like [Limulus polyphemus]
MRPNRAIPVEKQQNVRGTIFLWQRKDYATLHIHVQVHGFNVSRHEHGEHAGAKSHQHGFHVHEKGDLSNDCQSTGPHFNPTNAEKHGGPRSQIRHVGDLGNIACNRHGVTNMIFTDSVASLMGPHSIIGRPLVIHADPDDFGTNPHIPASLSNGNAGTRISCCIIEKVQDSSHHHNSHE